MAITLTGILPETTCSHTCNDQNSVLGSINTGFGPENTLEIQHRCNTSTVLHLYKETYLSEFETAEEKSKARQNLDVPSTEQVEQQIELRLSNYATKAEVDKIVAGTLTLTNYYTKSEVDKKLDNITLNLDSKPIKGSLNGVTSDGIWKHIDDTVGAIHRYVQTI